MIGRYFVRTTSARRHGYRVYDVVDRTTGNVVYDTVLKKFAETKRDALNKAAASYPGGANKRLTT